MSITEFYPVIRDRTTDNTIRLTQSPILEIDDELGKISLIVVLGVSNQIQSEHPDATDLELAFSHQRHYVEINKCQ